MFNLKALETTEFYQHRFKNFATLIIIPTVIALVIGFLFVLFMKRELTITSVGELVPNKHPISIQSTTTNRIIKNDLKEGQYVARGDIVLTYHDITNPTQIKVLEEKDKQLQEQAASLEQLKQGLESNRDVFIQDDVFGYRQSLKDYLNQREIYVLESKQVSASQTTANQKKEQLEQLIQKSIDSSNNNIAEYRSLSTAIQRQSGYAQDQPFGYLYQAFAAEIKDLPTAEIAKLKNSYLAQINEKVEAEKSQLDNLKTQQINNETNDVSQLQIAGNSQKMAALQATELKSVATQKSRINDSLSELQGKLTMLKDSKTDFVVKAPASGIVHLDDSLKGRQYLPNGTSIAEIYPILRSQEKVNLVMFVGPTEITSVKLHQKVRLQIARNVPVPITLTGVVKRIDTAPTVTKKGNTFKVTATIRLKKHQTKSLHYGLTGKISIITGKKTYFNFWKDRLLNPN